LGVGFFGEAPLAALLDVDGPHLPWTWSVGQQPKNDRLSSVGIRQDLILIEINPNANPRVIAKGRFKPFADVDPL
jgi:hypothetical protein